MDNTELLERIEKLEKQVELLQAEITAIKNIEVSEKAREQIDKMDRANKLVSLIENLSGEKMPDAQKDDEIEVLRNISQQAEIEVQSSMGAIGKFIDNSADESDFEWQPYQDGVEITKYVGFDKETVIVPELINNLPVRKIGKEVFLNCKEIHYVKLPDNLYELGKSVFQGSGLRNIQIPLHTKAIPENAFFLCDDLIEVLLPNNLEKIENSAFWACKALSHIDLPRNISIIGDRAFKDTIIDNIIFRGNIRFGDEIISYNDNMGRVIKIAFCSKDDVFIDSMRNSFKWPNKFVFYCLPGSSAQQYARKNNIPIKHLSEFEKDMQEEK